MWHLSRDDVLARLDGGSLSQEAERHLLACARCRDEVASLGEALRRMRETEVPEPSPLFWDHLASRVRETVAREAAPRRAAAALPGWGWWAPASGLVTAVVALVLATGSPMSPPREPGPVAAAPAPSATAAPGEEHALDAWELLLQVAINAESGEGDEIWVEPSSADLAATELAAEEQAQLVKVLNDELEGT